MALQQSSKLYFQVGQRVPNEWESLIQVREPISPTPTSWYTPTSCYTPTFTGEVQT